MQASKEFLKKQNITQFISFKEIPRHTVKLISEKEKTLQTRDGMVSGMSYLVEENNEQKEFFTGSISLIQKLANYNIGDTVIIEMKSFKNESGQYRSKYYVMTPIDESTNKKIENEEIVNMEYPSDEAELGGEIPF